MWISYFKMKKFKNTSFYKNGTKNWFEALVNLQLQLKKNGINLKNYYKKLQINQFQQKQGKNARSG